MGLPPKDIEEFVPGENTTVIMWKSYLIRTYLDQGACRPLLVGLNFDRASVPARDTSFSTRLKSDISRFLASLQTGDSRAAEGGFWIIYELLDTTLPDEQAFALLEDFHLADKRETL